MRAAPEDFERALAAAFEALPMPDEARLVASQPALPRQSGGRQPAWGWWLAGALLLGTAGAAWWQQRQAAPPPAAPGMPLPPPPSVPSLVAPPTAPPTAPPGEQNAPMNRSPVIHRREATP